MARWWIGAALVTLGLAGRVAAQPLPPMGGPGPMYPPPGAGPMYPPPGAGPMYPPPGAGLMPGYQPNFAGDPTAVTPPEFCPPDGKGKEPPPSPFSLPNDGSPNAWDKDCCEISEGSLWYVSVGYMGMWRGSLGSGVVAVLDPGVNIPGVPQFVDTGNLPPPNAPPVADFSDVRPGLSSGVRASLAYREDGRAIEVAGWYLAQRTATALTVAKDRLDLPFANFPSPLGFQGDNFLWLQADAVQTTLETEMASGEVNYRHRYVYGLEWIAGFRYLDLRERVSVATNDSSTDIPLNPTQIATYSVLTHTHLLAGQLGFEWEWPLLSCASIGASAKGAWGVNLLDVNAGLVRGDGFQGPQATRHAQIFSHLYDLAAWATFSFTEQWRIRAGYQCLFVVDVPEPQSQFDFNPAHPNVSGNDNRTIIFHGPMIEMQFAF